MYTNVVIESVDISIDPESEKTLLLLIKINTGQEVKIIGTKVEIHLVGFMITKLLEPFNAPTLDHLKGMPASLHIFKDDGSWVLANFLHHEKTFDIEHITSHLHALAQLGRNSTGAGESTDPTPLGG